MLWFSLLNNINHYKPYSWTHNSWTFQLIRGRS